jgi:hypothetical protein
MRLSAISAALAGTSLLIASAVATSGAAQATPATAKYKSASGDAPTVVARGLNNPRQISITQNGSLLVAEAGSGGDKCITYGGSPDGLTCFGPTGSISWVPSPSAQPAKAPVRVITGLLSMASTEGGFATGSSGVSAPSLQNIYIALAGRPLVALPPDLDPSLDAMFGQLLKARLRGAPQAVADLEGFEVMNDPDQQGYETNPYAVLALPDRVLVADAAANVILQWRDGQLSTFAVFPNVQDGACAGLPNDNGTTGCDWAPSGLAVGPDGSIYVSGLIGLARGAGLVYKLDGSTGQIMQQWTGLTAVAGIATGPDGSVYATQLFTTGGYRTGKVTQLHSDGTATDIATVPGPAGLAVAGHNLYVSVWSMSPAAGLSRLGTDNDGQVWRLRI